MSELDEPARAAIAQLMAGPPSDTAALAPGVGEASSDSQFRKALAFWQTCLDSGDPLVSGDTELRILAAVGALQAEAARRGYSV